jgi:hypothetical protein
VSIRRVGYLAVFALIAVCTAILRGFGKHEPALPQPAPAGRSVASGSYTEPPREAIQATSESINTSRGSEPSSLPSNDEPPGAASQSDGKEVIGRPFPTSASVENGCKNLSKSGQDACSETHGLLARMAQEPRDPVWARGTEAKLRELILATESGKFVPRTVECRTSLCVVEVVSQYAPFPGDIPRDNPLSGELSLADIGIFGHERNAQGEPVTVSVVPFQRR